MKKIISILLIITMIFSLAACNKADVKDANSDNTQKTDVSSGDNSDKEKQEVDFDKLPVVNMAWGVDMHTGVIYAGCELTEVFKDRPAYLSKIADGKYALYIDGVPSAVINHVPTKNSSESVNLFATGEIDLAILSNTAVFTAYDINVDVQILSPIQSDGIACVAINDAPFNNFEEMVEYAKNSEQPLKMGYHSSLSGPRIVIEKALIEAGLTITEDPADYTADVLTVDLKGLANLQPALTSKQVDAWVAPAPQPELSASSGNGKLIGGLDSFSKDGKWANFPCCTYAASSKIINSSPEIVQAITQVIYDTTNYVQENKEAAAKAICSNIGIEEEVFNNSYIIYNTAPTQEWQNGIGLYYDAMVQMRKFEGRLASEKFENAKEKVFNFTFINNVK